MPPGTPGEFWAKASGMVASSTPAVAAAAHACRRTFISIQGRGARQGGTEGERLAETEAFRSDKGGAMVTRSYCGLSQQVLTASISAVRRARPQHRPACRIRADRSLPDARRCAKTRCFAAT